jgi:DNA mismatch repair protein MutL
MSRIRILPDTLINQIAAGEVIERPSSVVKELLENALDAGARSLVITIEGGGRRRIRVADDGEGMTRDDALLAIERHATSKLAAASDLGRIATLGFRGEALPAIASVSRLTLTSSCDGTTGICVEIEGGALRSCRPAGHPRGTTMDVRDLFYNTPARAKFLKSHATELGHIVELVSAYAVTSPAIRMQLVHEGRDLIHASPVADERARVMDLFGPDWEQALDVVASRGEMTVRGLIAPPEGGGSSRRAQHVYVNGRLVRDRLLGHAVSSACEGFLPRGRHAEVFLFLACPLESVDVNVHPAKAEVRFRDPRAAHDLVQAAVLDAMRQARPFTAAPATAPMTPHGSPLPSPPRDLAPDRARSAASTIWQESAWDIAVSETPSSSGCGTAPALGTPDGMAGVAAGAVALAHYRESYIVAADSDGLLLVDQHAAHERILFERLMTPVEGGAEPRQDLMFPATVAAPPVLKPRLEEACERLLSLGFTAEPFGEGLLLVRSVPGLLGSADPVRLVKDLLDQIAAAPEESPGAPGARERLLATVACHAAIKVRMPLTTEKMNYLINELFRTDTPLKCPHGRPAVLRWAHRDLERGFLRP